MELIKLVVQRKPEHATEWSVRSAAAVTGITTSTVGRYFALFVLHRNKSFKLSTDPFFLERARDIVCLSRYPAGAAHGIGLCQRIDSRDGKDTLCKTHHRNQKFSRFLIISTAASRRGSISM